jgi:type I restriction enzyme S subunit
MADQYVSQGIPFLRSQNVRPFRIDTTELKFIPPEFHARLRKCALSPDDVVVVRTGYPGTAAVIPRSMTEANCADLVVITPGPELDPYFLSALFNSTWGIASVAGRLVGSAQQHFNIGAARQLEVHLPPIETQRKITSVLSAYDQLIENNLHRIMLLEEMAQRLYREWFIDFRYPGRESVSLTDSDQGPIPSGWTMAKASSAIAIDPKVEIPKQTPVPFVPMGSLSESTSHISGVETRINPGGARFVNHDTLFARITPCLENGKTAYVQVLGDGQAGAGSTEFIVLRSRHLTPEYVYLLARSDPFRDHAIQSMSGATGRQRVRREALDRYELALPPSELLEAFQSVVGPMFRASYVLFTQIGKLRSARDLLLPRLISGEIDIDALDIAVEEAAA